MGTRRRREGNRGPLGLAAAAGLYLFVSTGSAMTAELLDVVQLVEARGWRANLGRLCAEFDLEKSGSECVFKQISVQETQGRGDPRAFNVPTHEGRDPPYILIFHLSPLVGEFFVVSTEGELMKAFYRAKGRGFERIPNDEVREEFKADLAYWIANLPRLRQGLAAQPAPGK